MVLEEDISFSPSGVASVLSAEDLPATSEMEASPVDAASAEKVPSQATGIDRVIELIGDSDVSLPEIMDLIGLEIAKLIKKMTVEDPLMRGATSQRDLNDQIKAFAQLQKTLTDSDSLSKKDTLNLDGPKFKYVFMELLRFFKQSLKDAGVADELQQNIMLQFGDLVRANYEPLQRELNKIETGR